MSDGYRRANATFGGVALAAMIGFGVWSLDSHLTYQRDNASARQRAAEYQANNSAHERDTTCVEVARPRSRVCVSNAPAPDPDREQAKADLQAQQEMAEWAYAVFLATLGGLLLTGAGLFYIVLAYQLNAKATDAATDAAKSAAEQAKTANNAFAAERRPWVSVEDVVLSKPFAYDTTCFMIGYLAPQGLMFSFDETVVQGYTVPMSNWVPRTFGKGWAAD